MESNKNKTIKQESIKNVQRSVDLIMKSLRTIQNSKQKLIENDDFIQEVQYKQIA